MSTEEETQITLKILVDKARKKVLFAEADHSFVDILFSFLTLPMGTIIRLIGESSDSKLSIGSFNRLYKSVENLPTKCFWTEEECKSVLLNPINSLDFYCHKLKLNVEHTLSTNYYSCEKCINGPCGGIFSICNSVKCRCGRLFLKELYLARDSYHNREGIFVTEASTFIITDDLHVKPNLIDSIIQILVDLGITDMTNIEEMTINIGLQQVLNLLGMALFSSHPLTDLFLQKVQTAHKLVRCEPGNITFPIVSKKATCGASDSKKINAKAFVRSQNGKLLFVQAGADFIDFLFSFIALPLGTVEWLLSGTTNIAPSIDNLYNSVSSLNAGQYMKSKELKDKLLQPPLPKQYLTKNQIFTLNNSYGYKYFCDKCFELNDPKLKGELVRGTAVFTVTDNLIVTPLSSVSALSHLNNLKTPLSDIKEYDVSIGTEEALGILKASFTSSTALSQGLKHQLLKKPKLEY